MGQNCSAVNCCSNDERWRIKYLIWTFQIIFVRLMENRNWREMRRVKSRSRIWKSWMKANFYMCILSTPPQMRQHRRFFVTWLIILECELRNFNFYHMPSSQRHFLQLIMIALKLQNCSSLCRPTLKFHEESSTIGNAQHIVYDDINFHWISRLFSPTSAPANELNNASDILLSVDIVSCKIDCTELQTPLDHIREKFSHELSVKKMFTTTTVKPVSQFSHLLFH